MRNMKWILSTVAVGAIGALATVAVASDHREAPLIQEDIPADLADVYAFVDPMDNNFLVLAMTVNGFAVADEAITYNFSPNVRYTLRIDNDGDAIPDRNLDFFFSDPVLGPQTFTLNSPGIGSLMGDVTEPTEEPVPNPPIIVNGPQGSQFFCGPRDDPFYFDAPGFFRTLAGTGTFRGIDSFAGFNVSAIVARIPVSFATSGNNVPLQIWAETARRQVTLRRAADGKLEKHTGDWSQVDRVGNPAVNTALLPSDQKDLFNIGEPKDDANNFAGTIVQSLMDLGTNQANIDILASVAVPDTLKLDLNVPSGYPNGRKLEDDVIDVLFDLIFNQTGVTDLVNSNDKVFGNTMPFLADPFQAQ